MNALSHATPAQRESYAASMDRIGHKARGRMRDFLLNASAIARAGDEQPFYLRPMEPVR